VLEPLPYGIGGDFFLEFERRPFKVHGNRCREHFDVTELFCSRVHQQVSNTMASELGIEAPAEGDMKQMLTVSSLG
jgi:hypothetical protein